MVLCSYVSEFHGVNRPEAQALLKLKLKGLSTDYTTQCYPF